LQKTILFAGITLLPSEFAESIRGKAGIIAPKEWIFRKNKIGFKKWRTSCLIDKHHISPQEMKEAFQDEKKVSWHYSPDYLTN
jgi:hypothetical protein